MQKGDIPSRRRIFLKKLHKLIQQRVPGGNRCVSRAVLEQGISRHLFLRHHAYKAVITDGAEAAKEEERQTTMVSVGWPAETGVAHLSETKKPVEVVLPGGEEDDPSGERRKMTTPQGQIETEEEDLRFEAAVRDRFLAVARAHGIPEEEAKAFYDLPAERRVRREKLRRKKYKKQVP